MLVNVNVNVNVGFHSGSEWEVTAREAANGEQRSSCICEIVRAQGSAWRTEPSDLLPATSPHPLLPSQESMTISVSVLNMDDYFYCLTAYKHV